ncbi:nucleoside monophosphate kinase [Patescibacteria group bacterium]|nr:nucleoside monophosphate kinase [Patescibacteria group bacterium]
MKTILFHGPSGCGKDTQVDRLVQNYGFEKIATGEMFREMNDVGDVEGLKAHDYWGRGLFVPNELTYSMLSKWVKKYNSEKDWAFVSVVREVGQIGLFDTLLGEFDKKLDAFVHFRLSEEAAVERMSLRWVCPNCNKIYHEKYLKEKVSGYCDVCGMKLVKREDDMPEKIKSRLREYNRTIQPILDEYRNRGILIEIDASPSIEEIQREIITKLNL